ncbi:type II/IV secretion system protein [Candidatus Giovannonibacteria bacterium]|nr:type II/IV secretion system protein [Candidatus Giovannonibacteria bacterium]
MEDVLQELRKKEEEELARRLAQKHGIPYLDLARATVDLDSLRIIPEKEAGANSVAVIQSVGKKLQIVVTNPDRPGLAEVLDNLTRKKYEVQLFLVSPTSLKKAIDMYKEIPKFEEMISGTVDVSKAKLESFVATFHTIDNLKQKLAQMVREKDTRKASDTLELLLSGALAVEASDIHVEPGVSTARIRLRLDGVLQDLVEMPHATFQLILSRIKLISEIKLNIHDRPQDGRFTIKTKGEDVEVRTSVLPGPYGESVVMRLLLSKTIEMEFEHLGMQPELFKIMQHELDRPNGMILTTGPTGSGKTTTLYTFLKKISSPEIKIITIEDPIEYHIPYVTQTQVDAARGYDFSNGLRSILRQDPDVILVGEIRDFETAEIAMHAALTGHLVFSTLHTNNAPGTIPRLLDLGVKPNIISPAINTAMAQRLVRVLCPKCKTEEDATDEEKKIFEKALKEMPPVYSRPMPEKLKLWKSNKCEACNMTGYKGRIGVFEAFLITDEIERLIINNPSESDIRKKALEQGMLTMFQDGILKVMDGVTSFDELNRVAAE